MARESFILTKDIAPGQIIDTHADPTSNLGKLALKKVIDTLMLPGVPLSGTTKRLDFLLLDLPLATLPTDVGILTTKQHALYKNGSSSGLDDGSGQNRARGNLTTVAPVTSAVTMTMGSNIGIAASPANFGVGDLVRIVGQGLTSDYFAEVGAIAGPNLTFVDPGTANPAYFVQAATGPYNMDRLRRWLMSWVTALMGSFSVPAGIYTLGIFGRSYLADIETENGWTVYPNEAESPQLPGSGGGGGGSTPVSANKAQAPLATTGDNQTTGLTITLTPAGGSYVRISVNGLGQVLGDGVKTEDCYFSSDGGTTAKAIASIAAGDTLYWNGVIAGFNLATTDLVDMEYNV
jgi:hypothetical protein